MARYQFNKRPPKGVAAIEFFLILPLLLLLLAFTTYFGRYSYHYSVAHSAAASAANYMSKIPLAEITNTKRAPVVISVAREIIEEMTRDLNPGPARPQVIIDCVDNLCSGAVVPKKVRVRLEMTVEDIFFRDVTQLSLPISVSITVPYRGR